MTEAGLAPARPLGHKILSLVCLLFHHSARVTTFITHSNCTMQQIEDQRIFGQKPEIFRNDWF